MRRDDNTAALKNALIASCKDIGAQGFDVHSGHGIVQPLGAYDRLTRIVKLPHLDTTPTRDLIGTPVVLDRPDTPVIPDRIGTPIIQDQLSTPVILDRPGTAPIQDQPGTPAVLDQPRTSPLLDRGGTVIAERIDLPDPGRPFVLATPHQAPEWQDFQQMLGAPDETLAELTRQINELHSVLESMVAQYQAATGQI